MIYVISDTTQGCWQETNAKTLTGAKIACSKKFEKSSSSSLFVGEKAQGGQVELVARRNKFPGSRWTY